MNKIQNTIVGVVCLFPAWILKSGFSIIEFFYLFFIFFLIPLFLHNVFFNYFRKNIPNKNNYFYYVSLIFTYSWDQNFGLIAFAPHIPNIFSISAYPIFIYISAVFIFLIIFLMIMTFVLILKNNSIKILTIFTLTILLLNLFDERNYLVFQKKFDRQIKNFDDKKIKKSNIDDKTLVLVLDEMSGINSYESSINLDTKKKLENFFKKYNFTYYKDAFSLNQMSRFSLPMLLNFKYDEDQLDHYELLNQTQWTDRNPNYWLTEATILKNEFFDLFDKITVFQSMHLDFCEHKNVNNCLQYNPFKRNYKYIDGVNNPKHSRMISLWKIQGSIFSNLVWRSLREFRIIDNTLEPYGQKMIFEDLLNRVNQNLFYDDSDLIFAHLMVPHNPYGYNSECQYEGKKSMKRYKMTILDEVNQHNLERECVIKYLETFFNEIDKFNKWENLNVIILSDHGARISVKNFKASYLSSIFAIRLKNTYMGAIKGDVSIQYLLSKYFNKSHNE
tara:strand:+ start:1219 stop:2724 length:1506 start_codon:yes stop_codon:yes gene_type:complete